MNDGLPTDEPGTLKELREKALGCKGTRQRGMNRKPGCFMFDERSEVGPKRGVQTAAELLDEIAIGEMDATKSLLLEVVQPLHNVISNTTVGALTRFMQDNGVGLKKRMTGMDSELVQGRITILMLLNYLGQHRVRVKTRGLVLETGGQEAGEDVLSVDLNPRRKGVEPDAKGVVIAKRMKRGNVKSKVKAMAHNT
jgi:hypothetical protein